MNPQSLRKKISQADAAPYSRVRSYAQYEERRKRQKLVKNAKHDSGRLENQRGAENDDEGAEHGALCDAERSGRGTTSRWCVGSTGLTSAAGAS